MTKKARRRDIIIAVIGVLGLMLTTINVNPASAEISTGQIKNLSK